MVWGGDQPSQPADQLSVLVSRLRSILGADRLIRTQGGYLLRADWLDVDAVGELSDEARRRLDAGAVAPANAAARAAVDLLRGPLLPEEPQESPWLEPEWVLAARYAATARSRPSRCSPLAIRGRLAEQVLTAEPYDESALRTLMTAHESAGRPALALQAYADVARRLRTNSA